MAAAKFLDTISISVGVLGEARDAVSAYTRVHMIDYARQLMLPEEDCPDIWIRILARQ